MFLMGRHLVCMEKNAKLIAIVVSECSACPAVPHPEWSGLVSLVILVSSNSLWEKGAVGEKFCKTGAVSRLETRPAHVLVHCPHDIVSFRWLGDGWKWAGKPKGLEFACYCTTSICFFPLIQSPSLESLRAPPKHYSPPPLSNRRSLGEIGEREPCWD